VHPGPSSRWLHQRSVCKLSSDLQRALIVYVDIPCIPGHVTSISNSQRVCILCQSGNVGDSSMLLLSAQHCGNIPARQTQWHFGDHAHSCTTRPAASDADGVGRGASGKFLRSHSRVGAVRRGIIDADPLITLCSVHRLLQSVVSL